MEKLKYLTSMIVFQEIPDEITLAINISGCPYHCEGCHSPELWEYSGNDVSEYIDRLIKYNDGITCVCFMGGDQNILELLELSKFLHSKGLKVALYTGNSDGQRIIKELSNFDYIKYGEWVKELGPLSSPTTNQVMMKRVGESTWEDITFRFKKEALL